MPAISSRPELTPDERRLAEEADALFEEDSRLEAEGKLKPYPKHLQEKMDSSSGAGAASPAGELTPLQKLQLKQAPKL